VGGRNQTPRSVVAEFKDGEEFSQAFELSGNVVIGLVASDWDDSPVTFQLAGYGAEFVDLFVESVEVVFDIGARRAMLGLHLPLCDGLIRLRRGTSAKPVKDIARTLMVLLN
jgi:hypothetical protein